MLVTYRPAPGADETAFIGDHLGTPTPDTAFVGLEGYKLRVVRISGDGQDTSDHVWPYPLSFVDPRSEKTILIEEGLPFLGHETELDALMIEIEAVRADLAVAHLKSEVYCLY